jgi:hypothetical protein
MLKGIVVNIKSLFVAVVIWTLAGSAHATFEFTYLPELAGLYVVGGKNFPSSATTMETTVPLSWNGGAASHIYLTYEVTGIVHEPVLNDVNGTVPSNFSPTKNIEFNTGGKTYGWAAYLDTTYAGDFGFPSFFSSVEQKYDQSSGRFYFGAVIDTAQVSLRLPTSNRIHNTFYDIASYGANYRYVDTGSVFVESARIGLSDTLTLPSSVPMNTLLISPTAPIPEPETYAMILAGLGLLGFMARRRKLA